MKAMTIGATLLALSAASAAFAGPMQAPAGASNSCIWAYEVDHTTVSPDTRVILFHLRGGKIVQNTLNAPCNGLALHGFSYVSRSDSVCAGQGIRVIESGQVCMLGPFSPYAPPMHT